MNMENSGFIRFSKNNRINLSEVLSDSMIRTSLLLVVFLTGIAVAYLSTYLPAVWLSVFTSPGKPELGSTLSAHDTSVIVRVSQRLVPPNPGVSREAVTSMNLALDMEAQGKREKALKLYLHAINLDPSHVDILTAYGEFLEKNEQDITLADSMYNRALHICPEHSKALVAKQRIQPLVEEIDLKNFNRIDKKLKHFMKVPHNHPGLRRAKKESYFQHIYHSNAIEGNTLTLMQTRSIIETRIAVGGKSLLEQNEVLGLDAALSFVNSTLLGKIGNISLLDILEIHKRVLGYVDLTEAGRLRQTQVFVGDFTPPAAQDIPSLMDGFIEWMNSEEALQLHPIEYAALAHYKLVYIHPFYDGNGRTSRLLMNLILMQAGYPPVIVRVEDRQTYYDTLQLVNMGDVHPFIRFIAECTERTLDYFLVATSDVHSGLTIQKINTTKNVIVGGIGEE